MKADFNRLSQTVLKLDKKAQELDELIKNVRIEIHNVFWELIALKKEQERKAR